MMALERWQRNRPREALRAIVVPAQPWRVGDPIDKRQHRVRSVAEPWREEVCDVRPIAAEELVTPLARQRDLDVFDREARNEVRRQRRAVAEGLVVRAGEQGKQRGGV